MSLFFNKKKNVALVLSGGGGKGAYQAGALNALVDLGIDTKIEAISGTSVGALNACLFVQNKIDILNYVWLNEVSEKILTTHSETLFDRIKNAVENYDFPDIFKDNVLSFSENGIFSRDGLIEVMDKYIDFNIISKSKIELYACAVHLDTLKLKYFKMNKLKEESIKEILIATSSIPLIFGTEDIDGKTYVDGGLPIYGDNSPIKPVYDAGYKNIIVIHLFDIDILDESDYPNANIYQVYSKEGMAGILSGVLDFSEKTAKSKIEAGYKDTIEVLSGLDFNN